MAAKSLDIHPSALAELKSSISWYLEQNEATADKFVAEIDQAIDLVLASPRRWPASDLDTRKFVLRRFPYALIYHERNQWLESWPSPTDTGSLDIGKIESEILTKSLGRPDCPRVDSWIVLRKIETWISSPNRCLLRFQCEPDL